MRSAARPARSRRCSASSELPESTYRFAGRAQQQASGHGRVRAIGVVTKTARVHARAWKRLFDGYLEARASRREEVFRPFDREAAYLAFVDGKPRYEGVRSFLASRGIEIPLSLRTAAAASAVPSRSIEGCATTRPTATTSRSPS
jgi:hypothetical protein